MGQGPSRFQLAAIALLTAAGCDSQFSPAYTGESLLTITGSVELAQERRKELIIPALAFSTPDEGKVTIREVDVRGEFPSNFRLDVYQPPPRSTYFNPTHQLSGEPRIAAGYVTAVTPDHEDVLRSATFESVSSYACPLEGCDEPCGGEGCLVQSFEYCVLAHPELPCFVEEFRCPTFNSPNEECTLEAVSGDPMLKESPWRDFAGFSQNYIVVYLERPAAAGSVTAAILGSRGKRAPAGYGLYSMRELTQAESAARDACVDEAEVLAAAGFNEELGTDLTTLDFEIACAPNMMSAPGPMGPCSGSMPPPETIPRARGPIPGEPSDPTPPPPIPEGVPCPDAPPAADPATDADVPAFCSGTEAEIDAAMEARERHLERAMLELGCHMRNVVLTRVRRPSRESISVIIGPEVQPALWPN